MPKPIFPAIVGLLSILTLSGCQIQGGEDQAALQVTSKPEAALFLDGKHLGKTPFLSDKLKAGEYTLKITADQATYVEKLKLNEGTLTVVNRDLNNNFQSQSGESLWLEKGKKGIFIVSIPPEADITIDGKYIGIAPILVSSIEAGEHKVAVTKTGYIEREFSVKSADTYQVVGNVTLASITAKEILLAPTPTPNVKHAQTLPTSLGFHRVRKEASATAPEIGRVKPDSQFEILQDIKDWVKISFEGKQGWIQKTFVKIVD